MQEGPRTFETVAKALQKCAIPLEFAPSPRQHFGCRALVLGAPPFAEAYDISSGSLVYVVRPKFTLVIKVSSVILIAGCTTFMSDTLTRHEVCT